LKCTDNSRRSKYYLIFAAVFILSFITAYCLTGLVKAALPVQKPSLVDRRQLFRNYRFLNMFLSAAATRPLQEIDPVDRGNPLLAGIERLNRARQLADENKFEACSEVLADIPGQFPYIAAQRDELQLRCLYALKKYKSFVFYHDAHQTGSLEIKTMLLNCLLKSGQSQRAEGEFKLLFLNRDLAPFLKKVPRPELLGMLRRLDDDFWFDKFTFLAKNSARSEFRLELPYCRYRPLARLFNAEFAYQGRKYAQAQALLRDGLGEKYQPFAERILLKTALRLDPQTDILSRLKAVKEDSRLYPGMLLDAAQILLGKGEFEKALPLYSLFLEQCREQGEDYWKTVWLLAWIHYRQDRKDVARQYFQKGSQSPLLSYQIASRYWQSKLENRKQPQLHLFPFSYYTVREFQDKSRFKALNQSFVSSIDTAPGGRFLEIIADLKILGKYGLWDDCLETIRAAKDDRMLNPSDLNLLRIIESLIYYRQNRFYQAFAMFRSNFKTIENVRLPNFLSGIFFPRQYSELIASYSREQSVDPCLVQALIREESFFRADSLSPAKAYGLMQLLHGTAREIARNDGDRRIRVKDLYDPETNIRLGLEYLKTLLDRYDGRLYLALAAYNAGEARVDQWLADFPDASEDEFIEMIPFSETRNYVKNILRNYFFYRYYYEKD
jgi:soluble lytic murein transglycosylase-like protein